MIFFGIDFKLIFDRFRLLIVLHEGLNTGGRLAFFHFSDADQLVL